MAKQTEIRIIPNALASADTSGIQLSSAEGIFCFPLSRTEMQKLAHQIEEALKTPEPPLRKP